MARKLRAQHPGALYHVLNRGDRREAVFRTDEDPAGRRKGDVQKVGLARRLRFAANKSKDYAVVRD